MATSAPDHFYFRCLDDETPILMENMLFSRDGNLPSSSWFYYTFSGKTKPPTPLGTHPLDGRPIYYLPISRKVCLELIRLMYFKLLRPRALDAVPNSLINECDHDAWCQYVTYYGLGPEPELKRKAVDDPDTKPNKKMMKMEDRLQVLETMPRFIYVRRVAEELASKISTSHTDWNNFLAGKITKLSSSFIYTYDDAGPDGNLTYKLQIPGEPPIDPVRVALAIGHCLKSGEYADGPEGFVYNTTEPTQRFFAFCMARALKFKYRVDVFTKSNRKTKAKQPIRIHRWPSTIFSVMPGYHDIFNVTIIHPASETPDQVCLSYYTD